MRLTGLLKKQVDAAATTDEKRTVIARTGMELTDDELDSVVGGVNVYDKEITAVKVWKSYTVRKGESLAEIAAKYNVTILTLIQHNKLSSASSLKVGQTIQVPM